MSELKCVVVTPERTELDVAATSVTLPLFDGEMGILRGHSPLVGRLGFGVLRIRHGGETRSYFVDGGFAQVADDVVSILTDRITPTSEISADQAAREMRTALEMPTDQRDLASVRTKAVERARALSRAAS